MSGSGGAVVDCGGERESVRSERERELGRRSVNEMGEKGFFI